MAKGFRALRARRARKVKFFSMDQFLLPRRFQRGITHPWERSGSMFAVKLCATENAFKTYQSENRFIVLLYSVVPSLASLAPERQLLIISAIYQARAFFRKKIIFVRKKP